jgi:hypothetical protein
MIALSENGRGNQAQNGLEARAQLSFSAGWPE